MGSTPPRASGNNVGPNEPLAQPDSSVGDPNVKRHSRPVNISGIDFHDTRILYVIEDTAADTLTMDVEYPTDWEHNRFERRFLTFSDAHNYQVFEVPFSGPPTILAAEVIGTSERRSRLRLETKRGL